MPVWIRKLFATRWTRRSQWSRLLFCQREFQRVLSKERSRVDRHGSLFGFIILRLCDMQVAQAQIKLLTNPLHRRPFDTDEKGSSELRERNERDGPAFKITRDPRTTLVGRFLRATGFDELPQLYNVHRVYNVHLGDMALVGPRPLPVDEAAQCLLWQKRRVDIKSGLTCFRQIAKSRNISFPDGMRLDLHYVRNASFILDLRLLARTVIAVFLGRVGR